MDDPTRFKQGKASVIGSDGSSTSEGFQNQSEDFPPLQKMNARSPAADKSQATNEATMLNNSQWRSLFDQGSNMKL